MKMSFIIQSQLFRFMSKILKMKNEKNIIHLPAL